MLLSFPAMLGMAAGQSEDSLEVLPISPTLFDADGKELDGAVLPGRQVILSASLSKSLDGGRPSIAIFEIRDSNGVTIYLAWQTIDISPQGAKEVGVSWLSGKAGNYELRVLHIPNLVNPGKIYGHGIYNFTVIDAL